ncbi:efflux RND transporter periplasmic adaptor subunit [Pontiellaceae bacterium B12219]|nr:efflux RND transporter periplasmic adaptor subunit [Pontiellaceae bacterium B12219]
MNHNTQRLISILVGILLLAGSIIGAILFVKTKPEAERRRGMSSMIPVVETLPLSIADQPLRISCLGTVIPDKFAALQAEVSGRIVSVADNLVEGNRVQKGDVLIEIESADYELALAQAEANLLTAQSNLRIEEGQQDVVRNELDLMDSAQTEDYRDLLLREPQLKSAQAAVKSAELAVESAQLNLERTKIRAPFDAVIVSADADIGDYAQSAKTLIELAATDRYFIRASVPLSALDSLPMLGTQPYSAEIALSDESTRPAQTHRLLPDLSDTGRMARILLAVNSPYADAESRPLLLNEVVRVNITGETARNAALIPRKYLRDGNVVWTIDSENKLRILPVELLQGYADEVLIRIDPPTGTELVITDLVSSIDGMQLRRAGERAPAPEGKRQHKQDA